MNLVLSSPCQNIRELLQRGPSSLVTNPDIPRPSLPSPRFAGKGRGDHFLAEADKHLKKFSFFGAGSKFEDAAECFSKAGNCFKVEQKWQEAGEAYMQAADLLQNKVQR